MSTFPPHPSTSPGGNAVLSHHASQNYTYAPRPSSSINPNAYTSPPYGGGNNTNVYTRGGGGSMYNNMANQSVYCAVAYQNHSNVPPPTHNNNFMNTSNAAHNNNSRVHNSGNAGGNNQMNSNVLNSDQCFINENTTGGVCVNNNGSSTTSGGSGNMQSTPLPAPAHTILHVGRNSVSDKMSYMNNSVSAQGCVTENSITQQHILHSNTADTSNMNSKTSNTGSFSSLAGGNSDAGNNSNVPTINNRNEENTIQPSDVACSFVYQYYRMLHNHPKDLHRFYDFDSQIFRGSDLNSSEEVRGYGQKEINEIFKKCELEGTTSRIRLIQAQECNGGINVFVTGRLKNSKIDKEREFSQTVFLAKQKPPRKGWYVCNEIFCYLDAAEQEVYEKKEKKENLVHITNSERKTEETGVNYQNSDYNNNSNEINKDKTETNRNINDNYSCNNSSNIINGGEEIKNVSVSPCHTPITNSTEYPKEKEETENEEVKEENAVTKSTKDTSEKIVGFLEKEEVSCCASRNVEENVVEENRQIVNLDKKKKENKWRQKEDSNNTTQHKPNPNWPDLAEGVLQETDENMKLKPTYPPAENYEPSSYAAKLFKNINARQPVHVGYAIPNGTKPTQENCSNTTTLLSGGGNKANSNAGKNEKDAHTENATERSIESRKIWVAEIPQDMDDLAIKKAVSDQLANINAGHVIQIDRVRNKPYGYLELDCNETVDILLGRGLFFRGRAVRIDYVRSGGMRGRAPTGGRGGRRIDSENMTGKNMTETPQEEWAGGARRGGGRRGIQNAEGNEEERCYEGGGGWNRGYRQNNYHVSHYHNGGEEEDEGWIDASKRKSYSRTDGAIGNYSERGIIGGRGRVGGGGRLSAAGDTSKRISREIGTGNDM